MVDKIWTQYLRPPRTIDGIVERQLSRASVQRNGNDPWADETDAVSQGRLSLFTYLISQITYALSGNDGQIVPAWQRFMQKTMQDIFVIIWPPEPTGGYHYPNLSKIIVKNLISQKID